MKKRGKRCWRHLTIHDRLLLERLHKKGYRNCQIADILGFHESTISRELKRGAYEAIGRLYVPVVRYSADLAQQKYEYEMKAKGKELKLGSDHQLAAYIEQKICDDGYSPEAVLGEIKRQRLQFRITIKSVATLYSYIRKGVFLRLSVKHLPVSKKRKYDKVERLKSINKVGDNIFFRDRSVDDRQDFGHWEMDCVVGRRSSKKRMLVLTERKTRYELIFVMKGGKTVEVVRCLNRLERRYKGMFKRIFKTITVDNGSEFMDYKGMEKSVYGGQRTKIYYCHPYSAWERGSNENQNKLIRRHVPKNTSFDNKPMDFFQGIQDWINRYPRRMFQFACAADLFDQELVLLQSGVT